MRKNIVETDCPRMTIKCCACALHVG